MLHQDTLVQGTPNAQHFPNMFSRSSMSSFKPCRGSLLSQLLKGAKINCARAKVNCDLHTVKIQDFWSTSTFWSQIHHLIKFWSWFLKKSPKIIKQWSLHRTYFITHGGKGKHQENLRREKSRCCTPKFSLPYFSKHFKKDLQVAQGSPRVGQTSSLLRQSYFELGFHVASR